jgi:hypothetical protein
MAMPDAPSCIVVSRNDVNERQGPVSCVDLSPTPRPRRDPSGGTSPVRRAACGLVHVPQAVADRGPLVIPEAGARLRVGATVALVLLVVAVPAAASFVMRPDAPGEGLLALALAGALVVWQVVRLRRSGVALTPAGIARSGSPPVPWDEVRDVWWFTAAGAGHLGQPLDVHHLKLTTRTGEERPLTRYPATGAQAARLSEALRAAGLVLVSPDRTAVGR